MSARRSAMPARTKPFSSRDMRCMHLHATFNPARWSGKTRNWTPVGAVTLNPERDCIVNAHSERKLIQPSAA